MMQHTFRAMGCQILAQVDSDEPAAALALVQVPAWFETAEQHLSRFRADSELMRLNHRPGEVVTVSPVLWDVLAAAFDAHTLSQGLVTPTLLTALAAAGYDRAFGLLPEAPDEAAPLAGGFWLNAPARPVEDLAAVVVRDPRARTVQLLSGAQLDFGGVAKGWAAQQAARRLSAHGAALVEAGGDIAVSGPLRDGAGWRIAVGDPQWPAADLALIALGRGGVATSGRDYRRWRKDGRWQHHLIDPRTGLPAVTDALAVTVLAPSLLAAETAAKTALILGGEAGLRWIEEQAALAALLVLDDGRVLHSRRLSQYLAA